MKNKLLKEGIDYIGVSAGVVIRNDKGKFFAALRGKGARNEAGKWEFPGGGVEFGEDLEQTAVREIKEEHGIELEVLEFLSVENIILKNEGHHWVAITYLCRIKEGEPKILEPHKCDKIGWFTLEELSQMPLSIITVKNIKTLKERGYE